MEQERRIILREELKNGYFAVMDSNSKQNIEKPDGTLLSEEWFFFVDDFHEGICLVVGLDTKVYYIKEDGSIVPEVDPPKVYPCVYDVTVVFNENHSWNYMKSNGELYFEKWVKASFQAHKNSISLRLIFEDGTTGIYE
ncbi:MAG: hypothetical protein J6C46_12065 [Clostridia bacterium]|nr:hypothetical protein [Clostridia bacterium]